VHHVQDSFLHLIADNLDVPVHVIRDDPTDRAAGVLRTNAVNLSFLDVRLGNGMVLSNVGAVIDVIHESQNTAIEWIESVWQILGAAFYAPILDYDEDPSDPSLTGKNMTWDASAVSFKRVVNSAYTHYSCVLYLRFPLLS
jgi:hypothetical protein